jgi:hypothetical protein
VILLEEYNESDLISILNEQQKMIDLLVAHGKTKHLITSFKKIGNKYFKNLRPNTYRFQ